METIYFAEEFDKLIEVGHGGAPEKAILLEVFKAHTDKLSREFIDYDTDYDGYSAGETKYYNIKPGWKCVLLLQAGKHIFTTIRDWSTTKEAKYRALRGQMVNIKIVEGFRGGRR